MDASGEGSKSEGEYLTPTQVAEMLGIDKRTLRRLVARGGFPEPLRLSQQVVRYPRKAVLDYLEKVQARRQGA